MVANMYSCVFEMRNNQNFSVTADSFSEILKLSEDVRGELSQLLTFNPIKSIDILNTNNEIIASLRIIR